MNSVGEDNNDAEDEAATTHVLASICHVIERIVARNETVSAPPAVTESWPEDEKLRQERRLSGRGLEAFYGVRTPEISVVNYLHRIYRYTKCNASCFVVGFVYIDRASHRSPSSPLVSLNVHRLLLTSVLIASKVIDDMHHNNAFFAKVGGVSIAELNRMELELLLLLDFGVAVTCQVFERYCWHLEKEMKLYSNKGVVEEKSVYKAVSVEVAINVSELNGGDNVGKLMNSDGSVGHSINL